MSRRVVVTGIGMINSLGLEKEESFNNIIDGKCGISNIESFDVVGQSVTIAGEIKNFDPLEVASKKDIKKMDRFIQLAVKASREAMADCKINDFDANRFGISSASGIGGLPNIQANAITFETKGARRISPFFIPSSLINMVGGFVSIEHGLKGPNLSSVTACAAGTHAISEAAKTIITGGADRMLSVGSESAICEIGIGGFASMKALSTNNEDPQNASRPFDLNRDGFVMGEGAGAIVLEEYESAKKRGAKIYCELVGFGESSDANHITTPSPGGEGAARAMKAALDMAGNIDIDYINAHGTSTKYNDYYETMAIKSVFKDKVPPISSTKGATGHCLGAAGSIEAVISVMAIERGVLPPTINLKTPDEDCDLDYVANEKREQNVNAVMSNSFGFGGTNGVLIFKKI